MKPSIGQIVHYRLTEDDTAKINRRRTDGSSIAERIQTEQWPIGAQAHIGNKVAAGEVYPMLIVRVWNPANDGAVNGKVELDGTDSLWVTSVIGGDTGKNGRWFEPPRV